MKYNDILKKGSDTRKVLGICGEVVFVSMSSDYTKCSFGETIETLLEAGWTVVEPEWEPRDGDTVWYIEAYGTSSLIWYNDYTDKNIHKTLGIYKTEKEAQAMLVKLQAVVKGENV